MNGSDDTPAFKVDEDLPREVAEALRTAGYVASTVGEQGLIGSSDDVLWEVIVAERRCLITADVGFADARRVAAAPQSGIVLLRPGQESRRGYLDLVARLLAQFPLHQTRGCVVRVSPDFIRVHDTRAV
jgi:predicted nuclease of predicted toxin-antitoxin system